MSATVWCPYPDCGFSGTEDEVDEHRIYLHRDEPQQGSSPTSRPRNDNEEG